MQTATRPTTQKEIKRVWHYIDLQDKVLGRISTEIAKLLMGKSKPYFVKNLDCGDYVVVTNARHVTVTGRKEEQKEYDRYSGYPSGRKTEKLSDLRVRKPDEIIRQSVAGMLPKNRLRARMLKRLYIYPDAEHPHENKIKDQKSKIK